MDFVINGKSIEETSICKLMGKAWKQYAWKEFKQSLTAKEINVYEKKSYSSEEQVYLLKAKVHENNNYCPFAKGVFKGMFEYVGAAVPSDSILEKLVTNCNQAGYEAATYTNLHSLSIIVFIHAGKP
ncbi:hypothetical protein [Wolbachia endosymbiont of Mansonella perstans]|uniref:hypothetical protein n=1 Tax=Wolbachia endosymbiont of Mansonella perstans TaxID=229526 RepID=UPI001CE086D9|nr:hypothetical protein [Wolbachia endosymbiont of Mansonella perstans]MCA4773774.1 hypothetical protein [Wolbachia endosymbiont of Mansonella perstans]